MSDQDLSVFIGVKFGEKTYHGKNKVFCQPGTTFFPLSHPP